MSWRIESAGSDNLGVGYDSRDAAELALIEQQMTGRDSRWVSATVEGSDA